MQGSDMASSEAPSLTQEELEELKELEEKEQYYKEQKVIAEKKNKMLLEQQRLEKLRRQKEKKDKKLNKKKAMQKALDEDEKAAPQAQNEAPMPQAQPPAVQAPVAFEPYPGGKPFKDNGEYNTPIEAFRRGYGAIGALVVPQATTQGTKPEYWISMKNTAPGYAYLKGRVETSTKEKPVPKVKFVRSGKRWGFFVG